MYQSLDQTDYGRWGDALNNLYQQNGMYLNMDANELARYQAGQSDAYEQLKAMQDYNDWEYQMWLADQEALAAAAGGSGGGGGGRGGSGGSSSRPVTAEEQAAIDTAVAGGAQASVAAALAALAAQQNADALKKKNPKTTGGRGVNVNMTK